MTVQAAGLDSPDHSAGLERMRAVGIALLVASHMGFLGVPTRLGGLVARVVRVGWLGTDILLVVAGYLCARSLLRRGSGASAGAAYLLGRVVRVLGPYYIFLALYLVALPWAWRLVAPVPEALPFHDFGPAAGAGLPFLLMARADLFYALSGHNIGGGLEALFALGVGMHATLLVTPVFVFTRGRLRVALLGALLASAWMTRMWVYDQPWPYLVYANAFCRAEPFYWGALWALGARHSGIAERTTRLAPWVSMAAWALVGAIAVFTGFLDIKHPITKLVGYPLIALASTATLIYAVRPVAGHSVAGHSVAGHWIAPEHWKKLGQLTYALYLWKLPVLISVWGCLRGAPLPAPVLALLLPALGVALLMLVAWGFWACVERRFDRRS